MQKIITWILTNKALAGGIAAAMVIIPLLAVVVTRQIKQRTAQGWQYLGTAQSLIAAGRGQEAFQLLLQIEGQYQDSTIADFTLMQQGSLLMRAKSYNQAASSFERVLERGKVKELLPLARLGAAKAHEGDNNIDKAQQAYQEFLNQYPDHFSAPEAYEGFARVSEKKGELDKAKESLEQLRALYPGTIWARHAETKLKILR